MKSQQIGRLLILLFFGFLIESNLWAQAKSNPKSEFSEAESYFLYEEFADALPIYVKLKEKFPNNYNLDYRIGRCYLNIPYERQKAIVYLENAVKHISLNAKESSFKETNAPLDALFYLGDAYRINNQLSKAIQTYHEFKDRATDKVYDFTLIDDEIEACERAVLMEKRPIEETELNLGQVINTKYSETNPVVSSDETMIVYAARLPFYQAMFYSKKVNGHWTTPVNMLPELGVDGDCFPTSLSQDGTELYIYRSNEYRGDLYVSNYKNGVWSKIRKLNGNINTKYWESHACISSDGKTLYFTSNRKGGYGGLDIYKSTRQSVNTDDWGVPQNLGRVINSPYNDDSPFITNDGKRLYFSSFGHETMGGYDIFYADQNADGSWSKPVNVGYPVNTTDDEVFFNPLNNGTVAYMAKFDPKGFGRYDIFRYELPNRAIRKYLVSINMKLPQNALAAKVYLAMYDKNQGDTVYRYIASTDTFSFETIPGNYQLFISCRGCKSQVIPLLITKDAKEGIRFLSVSMLPSDDILLQQTKSLTAVLPTTSDLMQKDLKGQQVLKSDSLAKQNRRGRDSITVKASTVADSLLSQSKPGSDINNKEIKGNKVSFISRFVHFIFSAGVIISSILILLFILIFIFIRRRKKKQKES